MSPVLTRRLPPDSLHTSWIIPSHPAYFFYYFFFFFSSRFLSLLLHRGSRLVLSVRQRGEVLLIAKPPCVGVCFAGPLSVQTAGSLGCSDPPVCCLRWPTPTPCSSFLRTRKRLALLTPSRGLALAGQEKRPPGWAGHRGGRAGREGEDGGGPAVVR